MLRSCLHKHELYLDKEGVVLFHRKTQWIRKRRQTSGLVKQRSSQAFDLMVPKLPWVITPQVPPSWSRIWALRSWISQNPTRSKMVGPMEMVWRGHRGHFATSLWVCSNTLSYGSPNPSPWVRSRVWTNLSPVWAVFTIRGKHHSILQLIG